MDTSELNGAPSTDVLQMLRANRPPRARKGARRSEYLAGLKQAEQLWDAASTIGPDARPILLFYGLSQAARALCVAGLEGDAWKVPAGHGLKVLVEEPADGKVLDLSSVRIEATGDSLVQRTARILDSPVLEQETTLAALIASRGTKSYFEATLIKEIQPVFVTSNWSGSEGPSNDKHVEKLTVGPIPDRFRVRQETVPATVNNVAHQRIIAPTSADVATWLAVYPKLAGLGLPTSVAIYGSNRAIGPAPLEFDAYLEWGDGASIIGLGQAEWTQQHVDLLSHMAPNQVEGVVLPSVGANERALHPLVTWWLILYALSVLARYYPRLWSAVLDIDESRLAVPMQHLLDEAGWSIRHLIAEALLRESPE